MKKKLMMAFAAFAAAFGAWAETEKVGGYTWTYRINGDTAEIYRGSSSAAISPSPTGAVTIPSKLGGKPVTSIGEYAFYSCSELTSVTIGNSVTSIGKCAFKNCSRLTSVTLPNSVTTIGDSAFYSCYEMASVTIGNKVTSIGDSAFVGCDLTSVTIPDSVTNIGPSAFAYCSALKSVTIGNGVKSIGASAFAYSGLRSVTIPDSVTSIGSSAFSCSGLTSVTIGNGVTIIEGSVFEHCHFTSVTIPDSVKSIGASAFKFCGLTSVTIGNSVKSIGEYAFSRCSGLTSVMIPDSVKSIGKGAFQFCSSLASLTIPDSVTSIGDGAFRDCSGLTSVTIGNGLKSIGYNLFTSCNQLNNVTVSQSVLDIGIHKVFSYIDSITNVSYSSIITHISPCAFVQCSALTSVTIPDSVTSIGDGAFAYCSGLTSMTIPDSVKSIGEYAFRGCSGLTSVTIPDSVTGIGAYAFEDCSGLTRVTIGKGLSSIAGRMFNNCSSLATVTLGNGVTSIGERAFFGCSGLTIIFEGDAPDVDRLAFYDADCAATANPWKSGWPLSPNATWNGLALKYSTPVVFFDANGGVDVEDFVVTDGGVITNNLPVAERPYHVFDGWFTKASGGEQVCETSVIDDTCTLFAHWRSVFNYDVANGEATVTGTRYGTGYSGALEVQSTVDGYPVVAIGADAFRNYKNLTGVTIPDSVASIGASAFRDSGLVSIEIPHGVRSIGTSAFDTCRSLTSVSIPGSVTNIGNIAFWGCANLEEVVISDGVQNIGSQAFQFCSSLKQVTIPKSVKSVGTLAFQYCTSLNQLTIGDGVECIGDRAFMFCTDLTSVQIPAGVGLLDWGVFFGCSNLVSVSLHEGLEVIGREAFRRCGNLESVAIPASVTNIQYQAFDACSALSDVELLGDAPAVENYAFSGLAANCTATVNPCASGWSLLPDGVWNGMKVVFSSPVLWFDANGGSDVGEIVITDGGAITNALPLSEKTHYTFSGWWTERDGGSLIDGHSIVADSCTLYAHWTINKYRVVFDSNGGYGGTSDELDYNSEIVAPVVARTGYTFAGWSPTVLERVPAEDVMYTAQWTANNYMVSFDANGGEGEWAQSEVAFDSEFSELPVPTRTDYEFVGWFTAPEGGDQVDAGTVFGTADNVTLYARWRCIWQYRVNGDEIEITGTIYDGNYDGELVIPAMIEGFPVTGIGSSAFYRYRSLTSVTIPDSVTSIGSYAFQNCSGMTSVTICDGVTSIGEGAFRGCNNVTDAVVPGHQCGIPFGSVTNLVISAGTTNIGSYAFQNCSGLTSVTIPDSVTNIGNDAFTGCSGLISIVVDDNNPIYKSENGLLLSKDGGMLIQGINGNVTIPDGVTCICDSAFQGCDNLESVSIPDSVTSIGMQAFYGCSGLTSVTIPDGMTSIGEWAFGWCESLTSVTIPDGVTNIGADAFYNCRSLMSVTIPDGVTSIGAFGWCESLTSVTIPDSVTDIGADAFYYCSSLTSVTIPNSVTNIGDEAFTGCNNVKDVVVPGWKCGIPFDKVTNLVVAAGTTNIADNAFEGCTQIQSVTLPDSVMSIGREAFSGCRLLMSVMIPNSVTCIGDEAFAGCNNVKDVVVPGWKCGIPFDKVTNLVVAAGTTNIGYQAFCDCGSLMSVRIPDSVTDIASEAFRNCRKLTDVIMADSVTSIGYRALAGCDSLSHVIIPDSVTTIGQEAFLDCISLSSVTIPDSVTSIGDLAFGYCSDLTQIIFEGDAPDIGSRAFERVDCAVTVNPWTRGWELAPNATWNGFALKYSTPVVFFDANGGVDVDDPVITDCGAFTNALPSANRTGYTFADWWTEPNGGSRIDESTIIADSCTLYGHWMINKYHVVFNANGGEGGTSGELDYNSEIVVPTVTRTGYTFAGWSPDVMERVPAEDVTFTAQWTVNKYRVVFDANGGDGGTNEQIEYATAIAAPIVTRTGYTFLGWDRDVATTVPAEDVTYVAQWKANTYKVSFDANGGEGEWAQRALAYDSAYGELPVPTRKHYEFLGWFTEAEGGVQIAADSVYSTAGDMTLYAHWRCLWEYEENEDGTLTLTAIDPLPEGAVEIPAELEGHAVTALGKGLFNGAEDITQAMIPVTIESLGDWDLRDIEVVGSYEQDVFTIWNGWVLGYDDDTVSYLEVPEGVVGIAPYALSDFEDMEEVVLPESLKYIGCGAFVEDTYLGNTGPVVIPDSVEVIDDEAFKDCSWIRSLTVGGGVRKIGARAFEYIYYLTTLNLPDSLEEIGDNAFINCNNLRSVKLPLELAKVGADPFSGCGNLTGVTVPAGRFTMQQMFPSRYSNIMEAAIIGGTEEICTNAFNGCSSLASVTIPVGVTNICDGAFQNCSRLASVELPETLEAIGASAFRGCSGLSAIVLPDSVSSIGAYIFYGCSNLANITLSRSITTIPDYAFYNCSLLSSIVVPTSVAYIGNYFGNRIYSIYLLCSNATDYAENAYSYMPDSATTYVQVGSKGWDGNPKSRVIPKTWNERTLTTWTPVQFDATFDANGGTFELTAETSGETQYACLQTKDTSYALPPFDPVWEGHIFDGWWTEQIDGAQITATTRVIEERAVTYYAHWIGDPAEVTVRFNANGGTVEPDENRYYASRPYGQLPVPTREYHRFAGWWTLPQGGSRVVVSTAVPAADQELYAHWTPETYIIRYHANGGGGSMEDQYFTYGSTVELRANRFNGKGIASHFVGWAISPDGPAVYADGKTLSTIAAIEDGVINLYAVWSAVQYAVRFDSNGGYGEMANQTLTIGVEEPLDACTFTRMGFDFIGWARVPGGDVVWTNCQSVVNLSSMPESTVVLYAVWNLVSPMPAVATDADVAVVMEGAASSLRANISSLSEYNSYRAWAETRVESQEAAVASENGWLSFALDAESVIARELTDGDVSVEKLEPGGNNGEYTLEVAIEDVAVGDNATSERLVKAFGLEGSSELDLAKFSGENVSLEAGEPKDGKVKLTVKPKKNTGTFFMRVKLNK